MLLLGIDLGTSSIKVSVMDASSQKIIASTNFPDKETPIISPQSGWAEQDPNTWWQHIKGAILKLNASHLYQPSDIKYIGIAYQMHGLVLLNKQGESLRNAIIWCDSRAVEIGQHALLTLKEEKFLKHHLNSPGNFTASKLKWVKEYEPNIFEKAHYLMLPGDFVSYRFTGEANTTISALSEGIFWNFREKNISNTLLNHYGFDRNLIPDVHSVFEDHGKILPTVAHELGLSTDVRVTYKAGDQPNNALSLGALEPGEVAATAGTSGVIYGVTDQLVHDEHSRVNTFAHVNYSRELPRLGVLLCINGTGITNSWIRQITGASQSYEQMNAIAENSPIGSKKLYTLPFGNGAERMLRDRVLQASVNEIDFNRHTQAELFRSVQEGVAFSFRYGLDILRANGMMPSNIRAGNANMFLSDVFCQAFVGVTNTPLELYENDGSAGAAIGAGIGAKVYKDATEGIKNLASKSSIEPKKLETEQYEEHYQNWKKLLIDKLNN